MSTSGDYLVPGALTALAATLVSALAWSSLRGKKKETMKRSWSFTSQAMKIGSFPPDKNVPDPIINCAILFDKCPTEKDVAEMVVKPMLEYGRLARSPVKENAVFEPIDLVRCITVEGDDSATYEMVSNHLQDDLRDGRNDLPWWEFLLVKNEGPGISACVLRTHHCLADGLSLVHIFEKIVTYEDGSPLKPLIVSNMKKKLNNRPKSNMFVQLWSVVKEFFHVVTLAKSRFDHDIAFSRSNSMDLVYSGKRAAVNLPTVQVDFVKEMKNATACTVNDVLLTITAQAIRDYCSSQNCPIIGGSDVQCRALMPVGFPRSSDQIADKDTALGNKWVFVSTALHVNEEDILERLKKINASNKEWKQSPRALVQLAVQNNIPPFLPVSIGQQTVFDTFCRHSMVFSNVMGPEQKCLFANQVAVGVQMMFENLIPQVGLLSYDGKVFGNMILDPEAIPNSQSIAVFYARAFVTLAKRLDINVPADLVEYAKQEIEIDK